MLIQQPYLSHTLRKARLVLDFVWALPSFCLAVVFLFFPLRLQNLMNLLPCDDQTLSDRRLSRVKDPVVYLVNFAKRLKINVETLPLLIIFVSLRRLGQPATLRHKNTQLVLKLHEERIHFS